MEADNSKQHYSMRNKFIVEHLIGHLQVMLTICFSVIADHLQVWYKHIYHVYKKLHHSMCLKASSLIFLHNISNIFVTWSITYTHDYLVPLLFLHRRETFPCLNTLNITIYNCCICACINLMTDDCVTEQFSFESEFVHNGWPNYMFKMLQDCWLSRHLQKQQDDKRQILLSSVMLNIILLKHLLHQAISHH
jgi:hypothetical protein